MSTGGASCSCHPSDHRSGWSDRRDKPEWITNCCLGAIAGKTIFGARDRGGGAAASGDLDGEPTRPCAEANFYEKGEKPLEIVSTRQWYIRNGGRDDDLKARCWHAATSWDGFRRT
jgi:hypothetical protein